MANIDVPSDTGEDGSGLDENLQNMKKVVALLTRSLNRNFSKRPNSNNHRFSLSNARRYEPRYRYEPCEKYESHDKFETRDRYEPREKFESCDKFKARDIYEPPEKYDARDRYWPREKLDYR